jgi:hypothetical protein
MPSDFRDQKNLDEWIEPDYFQRLRGLRRWRKPLCAAVGLLCVAGVVVAYFVPHSARLVQAGVVSPAHSLFNHDCSRCHVEAFQTAKKVLPWNASLRVVPDHACVECHDGPAHNELQAEEVRCATCHREHRGRTSLARVDDGHCTGCHGNLAAHRKPSDRRLVFGNVHAFNDDHPEFRLIREKKEDPGRLRFNHQLHLDVDGILNSKGEKERLQCAVCHVPDNTGRYTQPINYQANCARCHPLGFAPGLEARHRLQPDKLREFLTAVYTRQPKRDLVSPPPPPILPLPGKRHVKTGETVKERVDVALRLLLEGKRACGECHLAEDGGPLTQLTTAIARPKIPERWLNHARFGHQAHRMLACTECHAARESSAASDVLMPKLESCQKCHNGRADGARSDCAECHNYHDRRGKHETPRNWTIDESLGNHP